MADSIREYVKMRGADGIVRFMTVNLGPPIVSALTLSTPVPLASFEEKPYPAILDYVTLMDSAGFPWHARISALGAIETLDADSAGLQMAGYGVFGLTLRGATWNTFSYAVSTGGVITIVNTPAPTNDYINVDYTDGTSRVAFCRQHNLVYRPDERIYRNAATHCPVDGARLRGWRDLVRDRENGEDSASQTDPYDQRW